MRGTFGLAPPGPSPAPILLASRLGFRGIIQTGRRSRCAAWMTLEWMGESTAIDVWRVAMLDSLTQCVPSRSPVASKDKYVPL